jgi:hypothetical protein
LDSTKYGEFLDQLKAVGFSGRTQLSEVRVKADLIS